MQLNGVGLILIYGSGCAVKKNQFCSMLFICVRMPFYTFQESKADLVREVARAEYVTEKIVQYDPKCSATYVTLGSILLFAFILCR
jgi:hypothetical protein